MSTTQNLALWNTNECHRVCQSSDVAKHILDADCCHEENAFALFSLPRKLPRLFTVRFTAPTDFTPGDVFTLKGREFAPKTRTMEEPEGRLFSAGAVVQLDIDMERDLAFVMAGGEAQDGGINLGTTDPLMDGTASAGAATTVARSDHVHPTDTSRASTALAGSATATSSGTPGLAVYAADNDTTSRDKAVTPAGMVARVLAYVYCDLNGNIKSSGGIRSVSKSGTGRYEIFPIDSLDINKDLLVVSSNQISRGAASIFRDSSNALVATYTVGGNAADADFSLVIFR